MLNVDRDIAEEILSGSGWSASTFGLRFDRVAVRVLSALRTFAETAPLTGGTILIAISAPIRSLAKTLDELKREIITVSLANANYAGRRVVIEVNTVRIRRIRPLSERSPKLIGFVHNSNNSPDALLELAERSLRIAAS